jgi:DNA-binding CsgD family transcriptional regulator
MAGRLKAGDNAILIVFEPLFTVTSKVKEIKFSALLRRNKKVILSEKQREVFLLRMQGLSNKQVADKSGLSPGTVSDYYKEAIAKIRRWKNGNRLKYMVAFGLI